MDVSSQAYEVARAYYLCRGNGKTSRATIDAQTKAADKHIATFERFIQQCINFNVDPIWVLKVMLFRTPTTQRYKEIYPTQICSDFAWKRFYLNYQALERSINFTKGGGVPHASVQKKDLIMAQIRASVATLKQFRELYPQFECEELITNFTGALSPYHLALSKTARKLYKQKALSPNIAGSIKKAYRELVSHDILDLAREIVKE